MEAATQRRVLGVFAHPDDAEIFAGGTLLAHRLAGDRTAICVLTHGDGPRAVEAARGAAILGAALHHLSFDNRALVPARNAVEAVAAVIKDEQPHAILTHWAYDSHPDHRATCEIAGAAITLSSAENELRGLFWCDTYNGLGLARQFEADCCVDVSAVWDQKMAALMAHESQDPRAYCEMTRRQCALHGARSGVAFAEGFLHVPLFGRGRRARATILDCL